MKGVPSTKYMEESMESLAQRGVEAASPQYPISQLSMTTLVILSVHTNTIMRVTTHLDTKLMKDI